MSFLQAIDSSNDAATAPVLLVADDEGFLGGFRDALDAQGRAVIGVPFGDWRDAGWQSRRPASAVMAVVQITDAADHDALGELFECVQLVSLAWRPTRLLVIAPGLPVEKSIVLLRLGADGFMTRPASATETLEELARPGVEAEAVLPDSSKLIHGLRLVAEELNVGTSLDLSLQKALRILVNHMDAGRGSIAVCDGLRCRLAAGVNMPAAARVGKPFTVARGSILRWVLETGRARLVEGQYGGGGEELHSSIVAPLLDGNDVVGVLSLSAAKASRRFGPADLGAAQTFAALISNALVNNRLHHTALESERLAAVGMTVASVSHCMKNLLTILKGGASIARMGIDGSSADQAASGVSLVERATRRLENVTLDLLDYCRDRPPEITEVDLGRLLSDSAALTRDTVLGEAGPELEVDCPKDTVWTVDAPRLDRAVQNLVGNAADAIAEGGTSSGNRRGRIVIRARIHSEFLMLDVSDNGPGAPPDVLEEMRNPFYSTKGSKGTGLGLAMVSKFCEECGGELELQSPGRLGGMTCRMILPPCNVQPKSNT